MYSYVYSLISWYSLVAQHAKDEPSSEGGPIRYSCIEGYELCYVQKAGFIPFAALYIYSFC
jgi:hypothetical protein